MRLDRLVSDSASLTRSEARKAIKKGNVTVDNEVIKDIARSISPQSVISVNGRRVEYRQFVYIMMNKPAGVISATEDKNKKTVLDLLGSAYKRFKLFPAGRLDIDTEGFLLITNDGALAHSLLSPGKNFGKTYYVRFERRLTENGIEMLEKGVDIGECITKPAKVKQLSPFEAELTITEGKFHQIKRMAEIIDNRVVYLKRLAYGNLRLDDSLLPGAFRELTEEELSVINSQFINL